MHKQLRFSQSDKSKLFFTSDWHVFHNPQHWDIPIWEQRGYDNVETHAEDIIQKINSKVKKDDYLFCLGDCFLNASDDQVIQWLDRINCKTIYKLFGNHTSNTFRLYKAELMKQFNRSDIEVYPLQFKNLIFLGNYQEIVVDKQLIILGHFPMRSWNGMGGKKSWNISGHQHNTDETRNPTNDINRCLDVGWDWKNDVWSYTELEEQMMHKKFESVDHHHVKVY